MSGGVNVVQLFLVWLICVISGYKVRRCFSVSPGNMWFGCDASFPCTSNRFQLGGGFRLSHSTGGVNGVCNHLCSGPLRAISLNEGLRWRNRARPFNIITANFSSARREHGTVSTPDRVFHRQASGLSLDFEQRESQADF